MIDKVTVVYNCEYKFDKSIDISFAYSRDLPKKQIFKKITELSELLPEREALPGNPFIKVLFEIEENETGYDFNYLTVRVNLRGPGPSSPFPRKAAEKVLDCLLKYAESDASDENWSSEEVEAYIGEIFGETKNKENRSASDEDKTVSVSDSELSQAVKDPGLEEPEKADASIGIPPVQSIEKNNPGIVKRIADRIEDCFAAKENKQP